MKTMLESAMKAHPESFANFDTTKNVQDQLQEMVTHHSLWAKTLAFEFFLRKEGKYDINSYPFQFSSMEQLWLAYVMQEKYSLTWDGERWSK
ncbi:hypothetical protein LCGC14_0370200 [marine sediment metagenome]|uniref:Uncharacterized protein n=1 Tax=marine sediment metagenome TaxID=412755 RepID=A0A0F9VSR7_9ZZZZ